MASSKLDTWMLSRPKIDDDMWYDKLGKSSEDGLLLKNLSLAEDGLLNEECLIMSKTSKSNSNFSLSAVKCNEKHSTICRFEPQMIIEKTKPPKFPCLRTNFANREKRSFDEKGNLKKRSNKGL